MLMRKGGYVFAAPVLSTHLKCSNHDVSFPGLNASDRAFYLITIFFNFQIVGAIPALLDYDLVGRNKTVRSVDGRFALFVRTCNSISLSSNLEDGPFGAKELPKVCNGGIRKFQIFPGRQF